MGDKKFLLAIYDVSGIQEYIFATNLLKENAGASVIVSYVLNQSLPRAFEAVREKRKGIKIFTDWRAKGRETPEFHMGLDRDTDGEIIYIGGGNAMVLFRDAALYNDVSRALAQEVLEASLTLALATAYVETNLKDFRSDWSRLRQKVEAVKTRVYRKKYSTPFPIVEQEPYYGLPISGRSQGQNVSGLQRRKREAYLKAQSGGGDYSLFRRCLEPGYAYAVDTEDMISGRGEDGYVAVVHIDGNNMGGWFHQKLKVLGGYEQAVPEVRRRSVQVADTYERVFEKIVSYLCETAAAENKDGEYRIPLRLLIMDGDDLTFICNARLGLPLAAAYLRLLMRENEELSACAGVALVHGHFPFKLAYEFAEACCGRAKKYRLERMVQGGQGMEGEVPPLQNESCIDFQLARNAYAKDAGQALTCKPYYVKREQSREDSRSIDCLMDVIKRLLKETDQGSQWPRSRLKRLYETLPKGRAAVDALELEYCSRGYELVRLVGEEQGHIADMRTPLFDALELMELADYQAFDRLTGTVEEVMG